MGKVFYPADGLKTRKNCFCRSIDLCRISIASSGLCIGGLSVDPAFEEGIHRWPIADDIHPGTKLFFRVLLNTDHEEKVLLFQFDDNIDIALIGGAACDRSKEAKALNPVFGLMAHFVLI